MENDNDQMMILLNIATCSHSPFESVWLHCIETENFLIIFLIEPLTTIVLVCPETTYLYLPSNWLYFDIVRSWDRDFAYLPICVAVCYGVHSVCYVVNRRRISWLVGHSWRPIIIILLHWTDREVIECWLERYYNVVAFSEGFLIGTLLRHNATTAVQWIACLHSCANP